MAVPLQSRVDVEPFAIAAVYRASFRLNNARLSGQPPATITSPLRPRCQDMGLSDPEHGSPVTERPMTQLGGRPSNSRRKPLTPHRPHIYRRPNHYPVAPTPALHGPIRLQDI